MNVEFQKLEGNRLFRIEAEGKVIRGTDEHDYGSHYVEDLELTVHAQDQESGEFDIEIKEKDIFPKTWSAIESDAEERLVEAYCDKD